MPLIDDLSSPDRTEALGKIADLLAKHDIDVDEIGRVNRVSVYQSLTKNADGEAEVHDLFGVQLAPSWEHGPQWELVEQTAPVTVNVRSIRPDPKPAGYQTAVIIPDIQIGYYRDNNDQLVPTHDETAIRLCLDVTRRLDPELVVMVGDNIDLPELGKYRLSPAFVRTTQASLDRSARFAAEIRACAPKADIIWIAGNHEERLTTYALDNARAAFGIKQGDTPDGWPVLSVPHLCRFDEHGIRYLAGYPASSYWINERLQVRHGDRVRSNGSTAHAYLNTQKHSVIYGHIHRREWAERSRETYDGMSTIMAASPGTLARCDGAVPSTKGGIDVDGRPLTTVEDWQQGFAVVTFHEDGPFWYEQIPIHDQRCWWRGKLINGITESS